MTDQDLEAQVAGLFSETGLKPETQAQEPKPEVEQTIVDLLAGEGRPEPAASMPPAIEIPPPTPPHSQPSTHPHPQHVTRRRRRARFFSILVQALTAFGVLLLAILTVDLMWRNPTLRSGYHTLYFAAYTVAIAITLAQWIFNASLGRAVRETEDEYAAQTGAQTLLEERAGQLATANALLQKRTLQLQTAAQISQSAVSVLDPAELMHRTVEMVSQRFDLYHVGLFLIDESGQGRPPLTPPVGTGGGEVEGSGQWAVLQAATGAAGRALLERGYRVEVGGSSPVGWCTGRAQVCAIPDPAAERGPGPVEMNPLLPETRSQIALPLRAQGQLIGALDAHSVAHQAFTQEDVAILQTVTDQIGAAIHNARAFTELQARLDQVETQQRPAVGEQWAGSLAAQAAPSYERTRPQVTGAVEEATDGGSDLLDGAVQEAMTRREVIVRSQAGDGTQQAALVAPISLRGELLGTLGLHEAAGGRQWTEDEITLVETLADQMALAIENARLLRDTQQRAERERLIADISSRVRASTDVDTILRTAIRELGRALRASDGLIRLEGGDEAGRTVAGEEIVEDDGADA